MFHWILNSGERNETIKALHLKWITSTSLFLLFGSHLQPTASCFLIACSSAWQTCPGLSLFSVTYSATQATIHDHATSGRVLTASQFTVTPFPDPTLVWHPTRMRPLNKMRGNLAKTNWGLCVVGFHPQDYISFQDACKKLKWCFLKELWDDKLWMPVFRWMEERRWSQPLCFLLVLSLRGRHKLS